MARRRERRRPPEVLRRLYGSRVCPLGKTILSFLPPPPPSPAECRCRGKLCLACGRAPHLLREGDPPDYRRLLADAFCVISPGAPPPPVIFLPCGYSQRLLVRNTVELIKNSELPSNVLCDIRGKQSSSNPADEILCTNVWDLLLMRIGDSLMVFLLRFSSIFIPLPCRSYLQVTGPPSCDFLQRSSVFCKSSVYEDHVQSGRRWKRRRDVFDEMPKKDDISGLPTNLQGVDNLVDYSNNNAMGKKPKRFMKCVKNICNLTDVRQFDSWDISTGSGNDDHDTTQEFHIKSNKSLHDNSREPARLKSSDPISQTSACEATESSCIHGDYRSADSGYEQVQLGEDFLSSPSQVMHMEQPSPCSQNQNGVSRSCGTNNSRRSSRKHARMYSWQRRRKFKHDNSHEENKDNKCNSLLRENEISRMKLQQSSHINSSGRPVDSVRLVNNGMITESYNLKESTSLIQRRVTPLNAEDMHQQRVTFQFENRLKNLHNGSPSCEIPSEEYASFIKQHEHQSHSEVASSCFICLMLQAPEGVSTRAEIKRRHIFYSKFSNCFGFPRNHIFNRVKPNDSGAIFLMKHIVGLPNSLLNTIRPCIHCKEFSAVNVKCTYHSVLSLLKSLIRNVKRCPYKKLLHRHCAISTYGKCNQDSGQSRFKAMKREDSSLKMLTKENDMLLHTPSNMDCENYSGRDYGKEQKEKLNEKSSRVCSLQFDLIESYSSHHQVASFVWAVTRRIVPIELLGDSSTWRALRKNIAKFIGLRRYENFCLKQCIHGLKTSRHPLLSKIRLFESNCDHMINHESGNFNNKKERKQHCQAKMFIYHKFFWNWIYWFFNYIVVPLIRNNFYVTERESRKQNVYYYLKPVWRKLVNGTITSLESQNYKLIDRASLRHVLSKRSFGFSKIRFLPKEKSVRLLANLKAPSKVWFSGHEISSRSYFAPMKNAVWRRHRLMNGKSKKKLFFYKSVNSVLHDLYGVLRRTKVEDPDKLGCSVFDYDDVYRKLYQFVSEVKKGSFSLPEVFIVVADVSKAFDSIDQNTLIDIMKEVIGDDEYFLARYLKIMCTKKSTRTIFDHVNFHQSSNNYIAKKYEASMRSCPSNSILIDQGLNRRIKREMLLLLLSEHLKHNILQIGQQFFLQKVGISQGSLLSSLLCSFYYGHLERNVLLPYLGKMHEQSVEKFKNSDGCNLLGTDCSVKKADSEVFSLQLVKNSVEHAVHSGENNLVKESILFSDERHGRLIDYDASSTCDLNNENPSLPNYLLLRLIDDFLFISTSKNQATSFFCRIRRGFREYNCYMNDEKFGFSFDAGQSRFLPNSVYIGSDGVSFLPWSGLLLNCSTLEIQADYTRYWGFHMNSTLTVVGAARPGYHLKEKLCDYMRPKCHPIFYDSNINSPVTVRLNAYQAFMLCAMKFHCYVRNMPCITILSPVFHLEIIRRSFSYMYHLIKKRMCDMEHCLNFQPVLELKKAEVIWLGMSAYIKVLKKKQARYKELLSLLNSEIMALGRMDDSSPHLRYAVDDSRSSMFWKIKY